MRTWAGLALTTAFLLAAPASAADDAAAKIKAQKQSAIDAWTSLEIGAPATLETKHLFIYAPKSLAGRLKFIGPLLERYYEQAARALKLDTKKEIHPGKVTVYLLSNRDQFAAFARRVEKRRPAPGESASFSAADDKLHSVGAPAAGKYPVSAEVRAGEQLAALVLQRSAGQRTPLPDWLLGGFARATSYRLVPGEKFVLNERKKAKMLSKTRKPGDIWGGSLEASEVDALQGSLADFFAYGPGAARFAKLVAGFKPDEGLAAKTTLQALEAAGLTAEKVEKSWKAWVLNPK
jgi:hypothetical protein